MNEFTSKSSADIDSAATRYKSRLSRARTEVDEFGVAAASIAAKHAGPITVGEPCKVLSVAAWPGSDMNSPGAQHRVDSDPQLFIQLWFSHLKASVFCVLVIGPQIYNQFCKNVEFPN